METLEQKLIQDGVNNWLKHSNKEWKKFFIDEELDEKTSLLDKLDNGQRVFDVFCDCYPMVNRELTDEDLKAIQKSLE